jgi:hypothetical protein
MNRPLPVLYDDMVTRCVKPPPKVPLSMMTIIRGCYAISPTAACTIGFYMKNWYRTLVDHLSSSYLILFDIKNSVPPLPPGAGQLEKREGISAVSPRRTATYKLASRRFLAGGHLQAISAWHFTSKNSSNRLLYGVRPTKHYVGNPSEIRDRMLIQGQWWPGLGRNGPVQHGFPHRHFDHFVHPPYDIHGIRSIDLCVPSMAS